MTTDDAVQPDGPLIRWDHLIVAVLVFALLLATSIYSFLLFHSLVEAIISVVGFSVFVVAWTARRFMNNNYLMLLAVANLFVGLLGIAHLLAYKGMEVFPGDSADLPTQLWILLRYISSISLVLAPLLIGRKVNWYGVISIYAAVTAVALAAIFLGAFPSAFIEGSGLTQFKIVSEYAISGLFIVGIVLLYRKREVFIPSIFRLIAASAFLAIAGELMFTLYNDVYGLLNLLGHLAVLASSLLIFLAIVRTGIVQPYDVIFRSLKRSEDSLRSERDFAEAIITNAQAIILVVDLEGRILRVNPFIQEVSGWKQEELVSREWTEALVPEEDAEAGRCAVCDMLDRTERMSFAGRIRTKDGRIREVEWRLKLLKSSNDLPEGILFIGHDVTEERRLECVLSLRAEELARSNAELNQFAYVASHDLQEPLRMVLSYLGLLEKRYGDQLDGNARVYMDYAVDGAYRMKALISDLLEYSRVESSGAEFVEVDMNDALAAALKNLGPVIEKNSAVIEIGNLPSLAADRTQMVQVFQNLVGNAIKYHREEKPVVHVSSSKERGWWTFSVRDNGIGIAREHYEKIFQMFHRLHTRDEYDGTGIGLAIVKRIVERHGGRIWVESDGTSGSTFFFTLPEHR